MTSRARGFTLGRRDALFVLLLGALLAELVFVLMPSPPESEVSPGSALPAAFLILFYWSTGSRVAGALVAFVFWSQVLLLAVAPLLGVAGEFTSFAFMCGLALCQCGIVMLLWGEDGRGPASRRAISMKVAASSTPGGR